MADLDESLETPEESRLLTVEQLLRLRRNGVTPDYIRELKRNGYEKLSVEEIIQLKRHGVTAEFVLGLRYLGYGHFPVEVVIELQKHGVSLDYIKELKELGYPSPSPESSNGAGSG